VIQAGPNTAAAASCQAGSETSISVGLPSHHWKVCLSRLIFQPSAVRRNESPSALPLESFRALGVR